MATIPKAFGFEAATRRGEHAIITGVLFNSIARSLDSAAVLAGARTAAALGMTLVRRNLELSKKTSGSPHERLMMSDY